MDYYVVTHALSPKVLRVPSPILKSERHFLWRYGKTRGRTSVFTVTTAQQLFLKEFIMPLWSEQKDVSAKLRGVKRVKVSLDKSQPRHVSKAATAVDVETRGNNNK